MGQLLKALRTEPIIAARNAPRGTQLKLLLTLAGKQKVIFKPKWYEPNELIPGVVYAGKDRHRAEIVAFYLGAILNLRWTPIAVGRRISLQLVEERADAELRKTITTTVSGEPPPWRSAVLRCVASHRKRKQHTKCDGCDRRELGGTDPGNLPEFVTCTQAVGRG